MTPLEALQQTLAGEHAAVYVYRALAGRVSASAQPTLATGLSSAYTTHRGRRDQLTDAALLTEERCAEVYASMVGSTARVNRQWALEALTDAAVRQLSFGGRPAAFPGLPEL